MNSMYGYTEVATMATAMFVVIGIFVVIGLACLALFIIGENCIVMQLQLKVTRIIWKHFQKVFVNF